MQATSYQAFGVPEHRLHLLHLSKSPQENHNVVTKYVQMEMLILEPWKNGLLALQNEDQSNRFIPYLAAVIFFNAMRLAAISLTLFSRTLAS